MTKRLSRPRGRRPKRRTDATPREHGQREHRCGVHILGAAGTIPWIGAHLPDGWHLNQAMVLILSLPRGLRNLARDPASSRSPPTGSLQNPTYGSRSVLWDRWFEHDLCRRSYFAHEAQGRLEDGADKEDEEEGEGNLLWSFWGEAG
jgi:hypothetical protein